MLADRISRISMSPTIAVNTRAREMREAGIDVIDLSVGEPDFPTPDFVKEAGHEALRQNQTRYTPAPGLPEMRKAVSRAFERDYGIRYKPEEIIACTGAKQALFNAILSLVNEGDEVIIPAPYYVSYPSQVSLANGVAVVIPTQEEKSFLLMPEELEKAISKKSRMLILCNPNNPTGTAFSADQLRAVCECAVAHDLFILSDEIYEKILFDGRRHTCAASISDTVRDRTIVVNGLAKSHAMTGWRIGYAAAPKPIIDAMIKIQSQSTTHACTISQVAAIAALDGPKDELSAMVSEFQARRDLMSDLLSKLPGFRCPAIHGTFYAFPNVSGLIKDPSNGIKSSKDLSLFLLEEARVATVPGEAFGAPDYIRLSFAASRQRLEEAVRRISDSLNQAKSD